VLWKTCRRSVLAGLAVAGGLLLLAAEGRTADATKSLPKFSEVKKTVRQYFDQLPGYREGEILSRGQVEPVFRALDKLGWHVAQQKAIVEAVLPDSDPLVRRLRTPKGKKFARQVATVPEGYDRLDRLRRLPLGMQKVQNLIDGPDGYLMIKYMTTTQGGKELGQMLSQAPHGKHFNKPTGRIYTVDMLVERLKQEYAKATGTPAASGDKATSGAGKKTTATSSRAGSREST